MQSAINVNAVHAQLERILSSHAFSGADRASSLLRYVVDRTLAGESDQLKEYPIALEVLGRKPSFDPRTDPIVRVEAGRLRGRLEEYYRTEGSGDGLLITLPKGGYVPAFERREQPPQARALFRPWRWVTLVLASGVVLLAVARYASRHSARAPELIERRLTTNSSETPVTAAAVSPDGKYLAYADQAGIQLRLVATAEMHTLTAIPDSRIVQLHWFPDGTKLLASVAHVESVVPSVWSVSILGGPPRKLRDGAEHAIVSPDGSRIAFVTVRGKQIWVMEPGGEQPRRILSVPEEDHIISLAWGPDGRHLAYARIHRAVDKTESTIDYCNIDGAERRTLVSEPSLEGDLVFLNDRLIYARSEPSPRQTDANLWETRFDHRTGQTGGKPRRISNWSGFSVFGLSVTSDGKHLAFLKGQTQADAYVADVKPGQPRLANVRRLTFDDRNDLPFDWMPDSKAIIFVSDRNGPKDIFKQRIDQRAAEAIVASPESKWIPAVSVDGAWIIYVAHPKDKHFPTDEGMFLRVPINGGPAEPVMKARAGSFVQCPRSSSCVLSERSTDGKQLLFYAFDPLLGKGREFARMNAGLVGFYNWTVSRDGSSIAVVIPGEGDGRIRIFTLTGGDSRDVIVTGWSNLQTIDWAADGKGWYSSSASAAAITLLYIDLQGHAQALSETVQWAVTSPDGRHLALLEWNTASNAWMIENF
jgi:eukaryotic-like serine/threonine-protein kinase